MCTFKLLCLTAISALATVGAVLAADDSPLPPGAKLANHGNIGAGEGPAWHPREGLYLTGGNRIIRRDSSGQIHVFREPSGGANGLLFDWQGRLVACEARRRRVTRTEKDGSIVVLASAFQGKRFNSPNDLAIDSKGRVYITAGGTLWSIRANAPGRTTFGSK